MPLHKLQKSGRDEGLLDAVRDGHCAPVIIERIENGEIVAGLLIDGPLGASGKQLRLTQPRGTQVSLNDLAYGRAGVDGKRAVPPSAVGDLVIFENAIVRGSDLIVGEVATRVHDAMDGPVQIARVLARPTRASVSEKGVTQYVSLMDPSRAAMISSLDDLVSFMMTRFGEGWPGGHVTVAFRRNGACREVALDSDGKWIEKPEAFAKRMIEVNDLLDSGPVEAIPLWSLPVGIEQARRDVNPHQMTPGKITGPFTALYGTRGQAFMPSIAILTDEDEFAFGGPTGRKVRCVSGLHPLRTDLSITPATVPSLVKNNGLPVSQMRLMYKSADAILEMSEKRAARLARHPEFARPKTKPKERPEHVPRNDPEERQSGTSGSLRSLTRHRG